VTRRNARLRHGSARLRIGPSEWLFILPQSGFLVRVILRKNCTDLEFMPPPAGLHVIKVKGLSDAARRSNSPLEFGVPSNCGERFSMFLLRKNVI
jgi:hypothetical protein